MCSVVNYSEKSVKSDYLGVIICNWWRKVKKIGIFANQNAKYTANSYEDTKKSGSLELKSHSLSIFKPEYTKNSGHLMRFFRKIGKFTIFSRQLTSNLTNWVENSEKSDFSAKQIRIFKYLHLQKSYVVQG